MFDLAEICRLDEMDVLLDQDDCRGRSNQDAADDNLSFVILPEVSKFVHLT